jgi:RNA polymerase sigma-70 factor (ECF subfamily)
MREEVGRHVQALPLDVRVAVVLHFYEGQTHDEVAEVVGCPKGTASSRIRRGLEKLKESLTSAGYGAVAARGGFSDDLA